MKNEDINTEDQDIFNKIPLENVIHIIIHKTDKLQLNSFVIHPVVKIHIVDINTGNYYPKKHKERPVVYYYDSNLDYIAPIMTHPYNLQEQRSLMPLWEETILINEDFQYLVAEKENIIIFFEILDFVSSSTMNDNTKGWHKIAFAFLKIHGQNNNLNLEKKMRLQLYYCSSKKDDLKKCSVWETWHVRKLKKYPSSLYVTIESAKIKGKICTGLRSKDALQEEVGTENLEIDENVKSNVRKNDAISLLVETMEKSQMWKRSVKDITKLPNKCIAQLKTEEGCFMLNFSNGGQFLACALKVDNIYSIVIFSVVSFKEICHFPGHQGIIYSIRWSSDDSLIIAASADGSCSVWDVKKTSFLQILPHPNFVYSTDIDGEFIVTGCYDTIVRIWKKLGAKFMLHQELEGHKGYITCVRFKKSTNIIFSSDSLGLIIEWSFESNSWSLHRRITIPDLNGIVINQIELMGRGKRLLVHSRDSILRILDLNSLMVIHWLRGGLNQRFQTSCSVSPCGHYIIAGSENSLVNIWKVKNGKYVGNLVPFENKLITVHALQFHPQQDILAVGNYGHDFPVLLFGYDEKSGEAETHLRIIEDHKMESRIDAKEHEQGKNRKRGFHQSDFKSVLHKFDEMMLGKSK
ncbi:hypothetical protein HHI36_005928 [Cryptolaemus montrouzieri]|uniref:Uncharacterized protein n=1 Tax=Cryptolaemus montrouzieri TaxID=559131 RepID=A0ABD2NWP5_9CUCU